MALYVGDVALSTTDDAHWVCWRGQSRRDAYNTSPVVDCEFKYVPFNSVGIANAGVMKAYIRQGDGTQPLTPPDPGQLRRTFEKWLTRRTELVESEPQTWQKARSGRVALLL